MNIIKTPFGQLPDGAAIDLYTLTSGNGVTIKITNYGGIITSLITPDKNGTPGDIVLGFDALETYLSPAYQAKCPYFGAIVGRYGNRIAKGQFTLDGQTYQLPINNGPNHLHGGPRGFDKVVWQGQEVMDKMTVGVRLTYRSQDGEEGYPGNLTATVTYLLSRDNELTVEYEAVTDKPTIVNLTNHSYFNLGSGAAPDALDHQLLIPADRYVAVDETLIPTGELPSVKGTYMDFTTAHRIGDQIAQVPGGYDHTYVLNRTADGLSLAARVYEPLTRRQMEVLTTEPGVQLYTGNFLEGNLKGHGGWVYSKHYGFCLETQHFPDSPNQPAFPATTLRPGETFRSATVYRFSVK